VSEERINRVEVNLFQVVDVVDFRQPRLREVQEVPPPLGLQQDDAPQVDPDAVQLTHHLLGELCTQREGLRKQV